MFPALIIRMVTLQIALIAEPAYMLESRAVTSKGDYANIFRTVRLFEETD